MGKKQRAAGYWKANRQNVRLCKRKEHTTDPRGDTFIYAAQILDEVPKILATGFDGWIAPESHMDNPNTEQAWMWKYGYAEEMLEALYAEGWSTDMILTFAERHKGTGWRFPKIFIFDTSPSEAIHTILALNHCPWGIESELRDEVVEPPRDSISEQILPRADEIQILAKQIRQIIENNT